MPSAVDYLQPTMHPVYARLLCMDLRKRGFTQEQILAGSQLDWQTLHSENRLLSLEQMGRLVIQAETLSGCPWLGLEVGAMTQVAAHGQLGYAAVASADLRALVGVIQRFSPLRLSGLHLQGSESEGRFQMLALERFEMQRLREFIYGNLASISLRLLETASGTLDLQQLSFAFPFAEPAWADEYRKLLGPNVEFAAPLYRFSMPLEWLDWPCLTADAELARLAVRDCEYQLQHLDQSGGWSGRVRQRLLLADGHYPTLDELAEEFHLSTRTLIRRLREEGSQYQELLDQVRQELACWLLVHTELSVEAVAERLGYSDTSNFSRTFRRWLGVPPNVFRNSRTA
jgi:AraC-like DNA-binding protein